MITLPETFNVASYFVDRNVHEGRGQRIAIECGERRVSYQQLLEETNRVGNALHAIDVRPEERVRLILEDCPEFLYCFFGTIKIGAVAVPVNTFLRAQDYEYLLNNTRARVAFVSEGLLAQVGAISRERLDYLEKLIVAGPSRKGTISFDQFLAGSSAELMPALTSKDDTAFWLYSSGSTGVPKGCVHLHHDMVVCSELYAGGILRMSERDRCYTVARLFFAYGLGNSGYFPLAFGATTILSPGRPTPESVYADIERHRPTLFFSVPTNYAALLAHRRSDGREFDLSSVRQAISAGEPLPASLLERFKQRFCVEILDGWGFDGNAPDGSIEQRRGAENRDRVAG